MSRLSFAMPLPSTGLYLLPFLAMGFFQSLLMVEAFDMSVNTNVSRHSVFVFTSLHVVPVGHVSSEVMFSSWSL